MIFDLFNWLIFSTCDVLHEMIKTIFKIENLETIAFVEKIEMLILRISTLFAVTEKFSTKLLLKKIFAWNFFINFIFLIIKLTARKVFRVDIKRSE